MRKAIVIAAMAASVCLLGGCDFIRTLAGRPTSQEIDAKPMAIEQEAAAVRHRKDSIEAAASQERERIRKWVADSLALEDSLRRSGDDVVKSSERMGVSSASLTYRYYVMVGAFSSSANAARQVARAEKAGFTATVIPLKNGISAVGVCPTNSLNEVCASLKKVRREPFCPADAWILRNE